MSAEARELTEEEYHLAQRMAIEHGLPLPEKPKKVKKQKAEDILASLFNGTRAQKRAYKSNLRRLLRKEAREQARVRKAA